MFKYKADMMLSLLSFVLFVAASFGFVLAILSPNWLSFDKFGSDINVTVERGMFYVCNVTSSDKIYKTSQCVAMIEQKSSTNTEMWLYGE